MVLIFFGLDENLMHSKLSSDPAALGLLIDHKFKAKLLEDLDKCKKLEQFGKEGRLLVMGKPKDTAIGGLLYSIGQNLAAGYLMYDGKARRAEDPDWYEHANRVVSDAMSSIVSIMKSAIILAEKTRGSCYANLAKIVYHPPITLFRGMYTGCPGIVVSAGPSLAKNIDVLAEMQERGILVAVSTVCSRLLEHGIVPDFVCTLDYHPVSAEYIRRVDSKMQDSTLIALPGAASEAVNAWHGRMSFTGDSSLQHVLKSLGADREPLEGGGTVAHLAFSFSRHLGCDPIVFVGQDLSYTETETHFEGAGLVGGKDYIKQLRPPEEAKRIGYNLYEYKGTRIAPLLREAEGIGGETVYTDMHMASYATQFAHLFERTKATVINATEGGILKQGCQILPLKDVAVRWCRNTVKRKRPTNKIRRYFREVPTKDEIRGVLTYSKTEALEMEAALRECQGLFEKVYLASERGDDAHETYQAVRAKFAEAEKAHPSLKQELDRLCQAMALRKDRTIDETAADILRGHKAKAHYIRAGCNVDCMYAASKGARLIAEYCNKAMESLDLMDVQSIRQAWLD